MNRRSTLPLVLFSLALGVGTASAAGDVVSPDGTLVRRTKLELACAGELDRFCPALADTPGQTRNQVICLKPYRTSMTTYCRAAVTAAMK